MTPAFLDLDEVLALHADPLRRYGGAPGIRDRPALESARAVPQSTCGGEYLHPSLAEMAAAYLFHVTRNHPFVDSNQRVALASALAFLWLNGHELVTEPEPLLELVLGLTTGVRTKAEAAAFLQHHLRDLPGPE